jgi:U4/U6 small nuclear ribonucleoprotein PRP31
MKQIGENFDKIPNSSDVVGLMESDPEYQLIVEANNIAADIDSEISTYALNL